MAKQDLSLQIVEINKHFLADENSLVSSLLGLIERQPFDQSQALAEQLINGIQNKNAHDSGLTALLRHYDLSSQEGVVLMCLAEALLRIPDSDTADALIADKLTAGQWQSHLGESQSLFVNASTWALMLTGKLLTKEQHPEGMLHNLLDRLDAPLFRGALQQAMQLLGEQFVMGADIAKALARAGQGQNTGYLYSYDMLGEAALTAIDAESYQQAYLEAIKVLGGATDTGKGINRRSSISIKLSALYPRYEYRRGSIAVEHLTAKLLDLARAAKEAGVAITLDAEEAERLNLSLEIFTNVFLDDSLKNWPGLGLAVQAYQKRALPVLNYLFALAEQGEKRIPVRLVKGAYWDLEIKRAQQQGLQDYPVFTEKTNTDISYLACANYLLNKQQWFYPQFATHNAYTVTAILAIAKNNDFEFQRLHGMGESLYEQLLEDGAWDKGELYCRVYAPVGAYRELLPYLVRRLLENGANSSFVNQMAHPERYQEQGLLTVSKRCSNEGQSHRNPNIALPSDIFCEGRKNSRGVNFANPDEQQNFLSAVEGAAKKKYSSQAFICGQSINAESRPVVNPAACREVVGHSQVLTLADTEQIENALLKASEYWTKWNNRPVIERSKILNRAAELFEMYREELVILCVKEAGKTLVDALGDVREAIDFLRYYAQLGLEQMSESQALPAFAGESNTLLLQGRGVFVCISPWNFPVAIFTGQIAAALVAGNAVLAKPSSLTTLTAQRVISLLYQAGVPTEVLHYLPCEAEALTSGVLADSRLAGVAFTGSCQAALQINRQLAMRDGAIAALIAETGGQNVLMADSSAQPEQLVIDVITSAFNSAGQRCSALRVLYVQEEIADRVIELLVGAMDELLIGDPLEMSTDVGPLISADAKLQIEAHVAGWNERGRVIHRCELNSICNSGYFVAPTLIEIDGLNQLSEEHFGPVLHIVRYQWAQLDQVLDDINATGYGLTFGFHSRIQQRIDEVQQRVQVGNIYINRDTIGAVVGAQPFGGQGLSGTGPKAGGPHYLLRFTSEQTRTVNTAAVGGNVTLLNQ